MEYIDTKKLKSEITRIYNEHPVHSTECYEDGVNDGYHSCCDEIVAVIDSLQQEQPEVDLENELDEWMKYGPHTCYPWCSIPDAVEITARHFYELGMSVMRERITNPDYNQKVIEKIKSGYPMDESNARKEK